MTPNEQSEHAHCKSLMHFSKKYLISKCDKRGLLPKGNKSVLAARIAAHDEMIWNDCWKKIESIGL